MSALEVLGLTDANEIAFRFITDRGEPTEEMYLTEDDLGVLAREIRRDFLPLWPTRPCRYCGTDSVVVIDGDGHCAGHAQGYAMRENEGTS